MQNTRTTCYACQMCAAEIQMFTQLCRFFICGLYLYLVNKPLFGGWCIGRRIICFIAFRFISQGERTEIVPAYYFCGFVRVSWYGIVNQLFNFSVIAIYKKFCLVAFHDKFKV